jgi:hypothetical protein
MNSYSVVHCLFQEYIRTKIKTIFIYHLINADKASVMHHAHQSDTNYIQLLFYNKLNALFPFVWISIHSPMYNYFIYQNYTFSQNNSPSVPGKATAVTVAAPHHMWPVLR